ncbi:hypothetical protein BJ138DRAFT_1160317 [Hygrophoropsis aurantiaca]|uniref:Uncharacterized protein n=1 Tax=Hygrophoropsis aurantiaca TaxID=72124 RepID=A0ACB8A2F7_9AGAM|nr:hypothetical protein BJ138DRAFT_1160317 [Hygrophoropsis aurantiaca]
MSQSELPNANDLGLIDTWERDLRLEFKLNLQKKYASRMPLEQLPDEYRVTENNPNPERLHFAIPITKNSLEEYAEKNDLNIYLPPTFPWEMKRVSPKTIDAAALQSACRAPSAKISAFFTHLVAQRTAFQPWSSIAISRYTKSWMMKTKKLSSST